LARAVPAEWKVKKSLLSRVSVYRIFSIFRGG
jgi:hypothetical protein